MSDDFAAAFSRHIGFPQNRFHPLVWILGDPQIGENVYIGGLTEINATGASLIIRDNAQIGSFVSINCADSHLRDIGLSDEIVRKDIVLEENVYIAPFCLIKGGAHIGHHTVVTAGTIVDGVQIPPYSLVSGNPMQVKEGYYRRRIERST